MMASSALPGFVPVTPATLAAVPRRLIVSVEALDKHGKTDWSLTAPGPIAFQNFDNGMEGVVEKFEPFKQIQLSDYRGGDASSDIIGLNVEKTKQLFGRIWTRFQANYLTAVKAPLTSVRSIVWDTGTELWETARLAEFGKVDHVKPIFYGPLNAEFKALIDLAYSHDKNLIILHRMKKQYKITKSDKGESDAWTGRWERAGYSDMGSRVQLKVRLERDDSGGSSTFRCVVLDCRQQPSLNGRVFEGDECSFPYVAAEVFPSTTPLDWGLEELMAMGR